MLQRLSVLLVMAMWTATAMAGDFRAGAAMRIITPDPLLPVSGGMGEPHPVTAKTADLTTRVVVLEKDGVKAALVSVDSLGWPMVLGNRSREKVKDIAPENIIIASTHTHSAPDAYGFPDMNGKNGADLKYLYWACDQIADAINEASERLTPVHLKIGMGAAEGKIAYNYYAPQLYDPRCGVIQGIYTTGDQAGKPLFTLVNYAIHPEVIGNNKGLLGPDLCGPLYDRIAEKGGGMAIFMNSAQGGMVTADNRTPGGKDAETWDECLRIGGLLADEALRIVETASVQENPGLYCTARPISFPIDSLIMRTVIQMSPLGFTLGNDDPYVSRINLLNIGTAQILTIPGEALPNIGYYVKRHMPTNQPFLFGLANDAIGYMLTKVDFRSFERYDYISETSLGEMTGEVYMNDALKLVSESPKPDGQH